MPPYLGLFHWDGRQCGDVEHHTFSGQPQIRRTAGC
ncbi:hypothetical protein HU200_001363 [Digitaria exilis]|uniref:Uncharacterized protein n=1 Tax=Digitaria exilis TaxID=1010633 RepID=A0A835FYK0_9POAL|nr:hypothetical protein HU200_001363 [Digitaria exilis]